MQNALRFFFKFIKKIFSIRFRAQIISKMRRFLEDECAFVDIQTPTLGNITHGGVNEFPVAATAFGDFFSLPQSPQIYKQLLMCGGIDKYYQVAICYRDEPTKPNRQPEFTQLDLELSFTNQEKIICLIEQILINSWPKELEQHKPTVPFPRLDYAEAVKKKFFLNLFLIFFILYWRSVLLFKIFFGSRFWFEKRCRSTYEQEK
ncbi:unnamed protein product [Meloidogyne enterolobii]|uniref:Uncharacterized protein n=1 Tax=Meloidogyne enterolobii TaxID=390850 RepID=A0ACB0XZ38_MELEN